MKIGVSGPIDLQLLDWDVDKTTLPDTNAFPLTSHFINSLLRRGYQVIGYTNSSEIAESKVIKSGNLTICIGRCKPKGGRRFFQFEVEELKKLMLAYPAEIISAYWSYEYAWAALKSGIPTVVNLHDVAFKILLKQPDLFRLVRWCINYIVTKKAMHLVANSAYTYRQLSQKLKSKAITINNFYTSDLEELYTPPSDKENYIISVVQGFTKRKNIQGALHAFARLRQRFSDLEYHLVGVDMQENGPAHAYARKYGLAGGVRFIGPLPFGDVAQQVRKAKVLLHPSFEESFGMAILEAMVTGTVVLGGRKSGFVPHLLNYGKAGVFCDVTKPNEMAKALYTLLSDKTMRNDLTRHARAYAKEHFSEDVIIEKHLAYFAKVLGKPMLAATITKGVDIREQAPGKQLAAS